MQLHTDAHSNQIKLKDKMTIIQFIRINQQISPSLTQDYLTNIYTRITNNKFQIDIDLKEITYNRIQQGDFNQELQKD